MNIRPDVAAAAHVPHDPALLRLTHEARQLHARAARHGAVAINQRIAQHGGANVLLCRVEHELIDRDACRFVRCRFRQRVFVIDARVARFAARRIADNARAARVKKRFARAGETFDQRFDRAFMVAARGVDDGVGGSAPVRSATRCRRACRSRVRCRDAAIQPTCSGLRIRPRTSWPARTRCAAIEPPINPLAPVTKIFKTFSLMDNR